MADPAVSFHTGATVNLACFEVKGQVYALDVVAVREIVRTQPLTALPNSPGLIEGVMDLRGAVIPVLDLARVLDLGARSEALSARIVVLEFEDLVFGLWVDAATDVLTLESSRLEDVPTLATHAGYDSVRHVVRREGESPVMVLALESLLEKVYRTDLPQGEAR